MAIRRKQPRGMMATGWLGDWVESALTSVGITSERVEEWIGKPCNCAERKEKLNALHRWCYRILGGKVEDPLQAQESLNSLMSEEATKEGNKD